MTEKERSLGVAIIILFMVSMGLLRMLIQLVIVGFNLNVFLTPPFLPLIPFTLSISYIAAGLLALKSWRLGSALSILVIVAQIITDLYMAISRYGFDIVTDIIVTYSLDALVLIYLIRSLAQSRPRY